MNVKPYGDRLLIEVDEPAKYTPGGITIVNQRNPKTATVRAVGCAGTKSTEFQVGERVFMPDYFGTQVQDRLFIVKSEEVLGFVKDEN